MIELPPTPVTASSLSGAGLLPMPDREAPRSRLGLRVDLQTTRPGRIEHGLELVTATHSDRSRGVRHTLDGHRRTRPLWCAGIGVAGGAGLGRETGYCESDEQRDRDGGAAVYEAAHSGPSLRAPDAVTTPRVRSTMA